VSKVQIGARTFLYPMPTTIVGANVDGKPNFLTIAFCGIVSHTPPHIAVALNRSHYTNAGIRENGTFSVNIPSASMVVITDYCGLVSGRKADKSGLFQVFYGKLETAPMIGECPLSLECRLVQVIDFPNHEAFIGEIVEAYAEEGVLTGGIPDLKKVDPMVFSMPDNNYWRIGEHLDKAWSAGKSFKAGKP
jgi:flavin reductase (DIM6/NTAB) family NADH-FMN oxidoreductase RutF